MPKTDFGKFIHHRLQKLDMASGVFAKRVGVSAGAVSNWVNKSLPQKSHLPKIARVLEISMEELVQVYQACGGLWVEPSERHEVLVTEDIWQKINLVIQSFGPLPLERVEELVRLADKNLRSSTTPTEQ